MKALQGLDARVKLVCLVAYFVATFHAASVPSLGLCLAAALVAACVVRLGLRGGAMLLRPLAPILVVTVVMQVLYVQQGSALFSLGSVGVTDAALAQSARMLVCLLSVMAMSAAFMRCTRAEDLTLALGWALAPLRRMGLRVDAFMLSLSIAFRFIPVLVGDFQQLKRAQESRLGSFEGGVRKRLGAYTRLFGPLMRSAFRRADMLAEAFVSRGFTGSGRSAGLRVSHPGAQDVACALLTCLVVVAAFAL